MKKMYLSLMLTGVLLAGCTSEQETLKPVDDLQPNEVGIDPKTEQAVDKKQENETLEKTTTPVVNEPKEKTETVTPSDRFKGYKQIQANACNLSGNRQANVVVDIGFGDREYFAFTNEHGQLVRVAADKITLQDDATEEVTSVGRYCHDEAKVPGVESDKLDEGHVIADSLGGVSNAYNITPQESTLNRHGDQAYMEEVIRKAGGATNFEAIITYPSTKTQIPSHYKYTYTINGHTVVDEFDNINPDEVNKNLGLTENKSSNASSAPSGKEGDLSSVDTNGNGQVTIKEAKAAGYKMPITRDHWLYQYMDDRDGDGLVGE